MWGSFTFATTYPWAPERRPYAEDKRVLLDAYNASMFTEFRDVDRGTLEAFLLDHDKEFDEAWLRDQGMSPNLIKAVLKLGNLYKTRVLAHSNKDKRCTLYSMEQRSKNWDAFTASQLSNADESETLEGYAVSYAAVAQQRLSAMKDLAKSTLERLFPRSASDLSEKEREIVLAQVVAETRPAGILSTLYSALDAATGTTAASNKLRSQVEDQVMVGGYASGEPLRPEDQAVVLEMWDKIRTYLQREYSGYVVDIALLIPSAPTVTTTGETCFAAAGTVSIGLEKSVEQSQPVFHVAPRGQTRDRSELACGCGGGRRRARRRALSDRCGRSSLSKRWQANEELSVARLVTEIDNVRFTATTDATLRIFMRGSCAANEPDTIDYAKQVVAGYGYTDPDILALRSKRAHASTQYIWNTTTALLCTLIF